MVEVKWTPQAEHDLEAIVEYIGRDSPQYARLFVIEVFQALERISSFPNSGRVVPEIGNPAIREIIFRRYRLVFRVKREHVEFLSLHHGSRLLDPNQFK